MSMNDPTMPSPAPAPSPSIDPAPVVVPVLKPGYTTTEAWLALIVAIIGAIPTSGLVDNAPLAAKIVGQITSLMSVVWYAWQRTRLKLAHVAAATAQGQHDTIAFVAERFAQYMGVSAKGAANAFGVLLLAGALVAGAIGVQGCGAGAAIQQGATTAGTCAEAKLETIVEGKDPVIATVAIDLAGANYIDAIASLIGKVGEDLVACAVLAIEQVLGANPPASAGSAAVAAATSPQAITLAHARDLIQRNNWRAKYAPAR
jgi:hypothetical protein